MKRTTLPSLINKWAGRTKAFRHNKRGNIAIPFALSVIPVIGIIGAAVDYSRGFDARAKLQVAADAAVLAATKAIEEPFGTRQQIASDVFNANIGNLPTSHSVSFDLTEIDSGHRVEARTSLDTGMLAILGVETFDASASAESVIGGGMLEVALVLDNTGSMAAEIGDLREASTDLVNLLFTGAEDDDIQVAVVPYVTSVNIGADTDAAMLDSDGESEHHGTFFEGQRIARSRTARTVPMTTRFSPMASPSRSRTIVNG